MAIQKNDFIEIEFTGKMTDSGEVFDTNIKEDALAAGFKIEEIKPFILSIGHGMLPIGLDNDLMGKEPGKYEINLKPEEAFGARNPKLVKMVPTKYFHEQKIQPVRGMQISLDGHLTKILSTDKARTLVDYNNPLAGKKITYIYKINKIVTDQETQIKALQEFLFRQIFEYEITDKIITFKVPKEAEKYIKMLSPKFEEILGMKIETKI